MVFGVVFSVLPFAVHWRVVVGAAFIAIWNIVSTPIEYLTARLMYRKNSHLSAKVTGNAAADGNVEGGGGGCRGASFLFYVIILLNTSLI
jgi:hypothetical protein